MSEGNKTKKENRDNCMKRIPSPVFINNPKMSI